MSLPFSSSYKQPSYEPVYKSLFEIQYSTNDLNEYESNYLTENSYKIEKNMLHIHVNDVDDSIYVFDILKKLKKFSLTVITHNKSGNILGKFVYVNCEIVNLLETLVDFEWGESDILKPKLELKYDSLEYIDAKDFKNYERIKKLKRLTK